MKMKKNKEGGRGELLFSEINKRGNLSAEGGEETEFEKKKKTKYRERS